MQTYTFSLDRPEGQRRPRTASLTAMSDGDLKVKIHATGVVPKMPHA